MFSSRQFFVVVVLLSIALLCGCAQAQSYDASIVAEATVLVSTDGATGVRAFCLAASSDNTTVGVAVNDAGYLFAIDVDSESLKVLHKEVVPATQAANLPLFCFVQDDVVYIASSGFIVDFDVSSLTFGSPVPLTTGSPVDYAQGPNKQVALLGGSSLLVYKAPNFNKTIKSYGFLHKTLVSTTYADGFYYVGTSDGSIYSVNAESSQQSFISASVGSISALYPFVQGTGNDTAYFLSVVGDDGFATIDATTFEFVALNTTDTIAAGSCSDESLVYYVGEENQVWKVADFEAQDEAFAALDGVVLTTDVHTCAYNAEDGYIYLGHNEGQGPAVVKAKLTFD